MIKEILYKSNFHFPRLGLATNFTNSTNKWTDDALDWNRRFSQRKKFVKFVQFVASL